MSKINVLDSSVFNRIAAGEVVERPCSIVKELTENSIDAGADTITIEIKNGGLSYIRVSDNGCGIDEDDLEKAFLPHATSKIKNLQDLNNILTLGFRGEALTSIASVAKITLISKTEKCEIGRYIVFENGSLIEKGERGCPNGTTVIVEDLFKNIPARAKFLSKPSTEESVITDMVSRLILTNHSKSIKYRANGKEIYQSAGDSLKNAIYSVYGKAFTDNMVPVECTMPDITLKGFVNKPYFTKPNRTFQTLIVNGRYVINSDISYCLYNCYQDYLMKRQFPVYILEMDLPSDMVDVNVHPNKLEIKFADIQTVKRVIYKTVKDKLNELTAVPKEIIKESEESQKSDNRIIKYTPSEEIAATQNTAESDKKFNAEGLGTYYKLCPPFNQSKSSFTINSPQPSIFGDNYTNAEAAVSANGKLEESQQASSIESLEFIDTEKFKALKSSEQEVYQQTVLPLSDFTGESNQLFKHKFKACIFDTYIVIEDYDYILLIDQHAAHERLLYDKLIKLYNNKSISAQNMLIPYIFSVSPIDDNLLQERLEEINSCGFSLNKLSGLSYSLSAVPLPCAEMNVAEFISSILNGLKNNKFKHTDFLKDILMQSACKAAVKGEKKLSDADINYLLEQFSKGGKILMCPHGRPLMVKITKSEIEKWFKRTV